MHMCLRDLEDIDMYVDDIVILEKKLKSLS